MRAFILVLSITVSSFLIISYNNAEKKNQSINPVIGDISFIKRFGHLPDKNTGEKLRITTHLQFVENVLREKNVCNLPMQLKLKRLQLLNLLHNYWSAGIFPRNYDYKECRKPCFIDKDGKICAVGYLIEATIGRGAAENINTKHKYDEVLAMNDKSVDKWIENSGFTKQECAMIQPAYGPTPVYTYNHISNSYGISSTVLGGVNLSLNAINTIQMVRGTGGSTVPVIGLITGAGQVILGITNFSKNTTTLNGSATNESKKTLSMVNIGIGTTSMILSAWNLITKKKLKDKMTSWNIYTTPSKNNKMNVGLRLTRKL